MCQLHARAAGLTGTYRAWLSTSTESALSRLGSASGWVRPDGRPVVNTTTDLANGKMFHPIRLNESGVDVLETTVNTATTSNGTKHSLSTTCTDYTAADAQLITRGYSSGVASPFTVFGSSSCSTAARVYCFGIDRQATVTVMPPPSYRRAFLTNAAWTPGGGLVSADALCASQASAAGLPGTYKALLAPSGATAKSRFITSDVPWARVDGVPLAATAAALFSLTYWDSAFTVTASGAYLSGNYGVWGGATSLTTAGTDATTCTNWTSTAGTGIGGRNGMTRVGAFFAFDNSNPCNATFIRLACLQE